MNRMNAHYLVISTLVAATFCAGAAFGDIRHVPAQYPTIQAAIDARSDTSGDEFVQGKQRRRSIPPERNRRSPTSENPRARKATHRS